MAAVAASQVAMTAVAASQVAMAAIQKSQTALSAIAASSMATAKYAAGAAGLRKLCVCCRRSARRRNRLQNSKQQSPESADWNRQCHNVTSMDQFVF